LEWPSGLASLLGEALLLEEVWAPLVALLLGEVWVPLVASVCGAVSTPFTDVSVASPPPPPHCRLSQP
jgi:hypothetical protein